MVAQDKTCGIVQENRQRFAYIDRSSVQFAGLYSYFPKIIL